MLCIHQVPRQVEATLGSQHSEWQRGQRFGSGEGKRNTLILPISTCFYIKSSLGNFLSTSFGYLPFEGTTTCPFGRRDSSVDIEGLKANVICNQFARELMSDTSFS